MNYTYPSRDEDPWYDSFQSLVTALDSSTFAHREDRSLVFAGGGTLSWTVGTSTLTWNDTIQIASTISGRRISVSADSVVLGDGQILYLDLIRQPLQNISTSFQVADQLPSTNNACAVAVRIGGVVFFRTGISLSDGTTSPGIAPVPSDTIQNDVLWEWNGLDITQFGNGSGAPDHTYGTPDGTLSVGAVPTASTDVPSGNVLLYTTGTATSAHAHFYINDLPSLPERFIYRARLGPRVGGGTTQPMLIAGGQNELHWIGTAYSTGGVLQIQFGNNRDGIFTAAHYLVSSLGDENTGLLVELDCMLIDPDTGVDPRINMGLREFRGGLWSAGLGGPAWSTFGSPPAVYDSSWQSGGTIKNPGVAFLCNGTAAVSWVGELQILRHPWQKVA
jgi:hypothetical protein